MKLLGLIYGMGELPRAVALFAKTNGYRVIAIALKPIGDTSLKPYVDELKEVHVGRLGTVIRLLKRYGVKEAIIAGKIPKTLLYKGDVLPDLRAAKLLLTLKDRGDDSIINAVAKEFEKDDIKLLSIMDFCADLITEEGLLTKTPPNEKEWKDIRFGFAIAKEIGRLDIGQTVIVKDRAVMAVEAIEGTDATITRGGVLAGKDAIAIKVIRPAQDIRFDIPAVGLKTLEAMKEVKIRVIALEAGKSIILERDKFIKEAEKAGITVVGYKG